MAKYSILLISSFMDKVLDDTESATNRVHKEPNWNGDHVERVVNVIDKI